MEQSLIKMIRKWTRKPDERLLARIQERLSQGGKRLLTNPRNIAEHAFLTWDGIDEQEQLHVLSFDHIGGLISDTMLSKGAIDSSEVNVRDVCRRVLLDNASYAVVAHNHPTSDVSISRADRTCCRVLEKALGTVGIQMMDFIIVGGKVNARGDICYYSAEETSRKKEAEV